MMRTILRAIFTLLLSCSVAGAAQYWVATNGNNSNPGTQALPWLTIAYAASKAQTNDIVRVTAGNYYSCVTPAHSGSQGTNITYLGIGYPVTCGFNMAGLCNWAIIGFHFQMTNASQTCDCIAINRSTNFQILDNWFDHTGNTHAPICTATSSNAFPIGAGFGLIRSNFFDHPGLAPWVVTNFFPEQTVTGYCLSNTLFEYNKVQTAYNMIYITGTSNVIRNNYFFDVAQSYFGVNTPHVDTVEVESDGLPAGQSVTGGSYHMLIEGNMTISNSTTGGSKFVIAQESSTNASIQSISDFIIRKNTTLYLGSYIYLFDDVYNMRTYNNNFAYTGTALSSPTYAIEASTGYGGTGTILPTNIVIINNNFESVDNSSDGRVFINLTTVSTSPPYYDIFANNLSYNSGPFILPSLGADFTNVNPCFLAISNYDTHLTNISPGIGRSRPETRTTASGSSTTTVPVVDAGFFTDGWGLQWVTGDVVDVGTNAGVEIQSINYAANTLTLVSPITFNSGDGVFLDGTQDVGAYKYDPAGYSYGINLTSPAKFATTAGATTLTATVTNPAKVRIIRFYVDGLEVGNASPAPTVSVNAFISGTNNIVQARAYALYADTNLVASSTVIVNPIPLLPPTNLQVVSP
jgi:hypothetical protein